MRVRFALGLALLAAISVIAVATSNYLQTSARLHDQVDLLLVSDARPLIPPADPRGLVATSVCQQISSASGSTTGYVAKVTAVQGTSLGGAKNLNALFSPRPGATLARRRAGGGWPCGLIWVTGSRRSWGLGVNSSVLATSGRRR